MAERIGRFTPQFFDRLDELLPAERSPEGAPSAADFLLYDLPRIRDQLADDFEGKTLPADEERRRVLGRSGTPRRGSDLALWDSLAAGEHDGTE